MELEVLCWMTKDGARKPVAREGVQELLEADGWVVEGEETYDKPVAKRGRKPKDTNEE